MPASSRQPGHRHLPIRKTPESSDPQVHTQTADFPDIPADDLEAQLVAEYALQAESSSDSEEQPAAVLVFSPFVRSTRCAWNSGDPSSLRTHVEPTLPPASTLKPRMKGPRSIKPSKAFCCLPSTAYFGGMSFAILGAKISAYWWQRVGDSLPQGGFALAQQAHRAWLYVDDLLAALLRSSAHESLLSL